MNYKKIHDEIIERAKNRTLPTDEYRERHHVIPRCLGGTDESDNLVELTAREHYIIHQLLVKIYPENYNLVYSAILMSTHSSTGRVNNRLYEWLKKRNAEASKERSKKLWEDEEYRNKIAKSARKLNKERWKCSEYREKMNKASKEYWSNPENKEKASERVSGKNNPSYGTHWYHHPESQHNLRCKPDEVPEGYVKGKYKKPKPNTKCTVCNSDTGSEHAKYCHKHRTNGLNRKNRGHGEKEWDKIEKKFRELYQVYLENTFVDFCRITNYDKTQSTLCCMFKKYLPEYKTKNELNSSKEKYRPIYERYCSENISLRDLAKEYNMVHQTLSRQFKRFK